MKYLLTLIFLFAVIPTSYGEGIHGKYITTSTKGFGILGGSVLVIGIEGYTHNDFTDYSCPKADCPELYKPPFIKYTGTYNLKGNTITLNNSQMREDILVYVQTERWKALMPKSEYEKYIVSGMLPPTILAKQ